jgi:type IV pilus assembly protein PilA
MFCAQCGANNADRAAFCAQCGGALQSQPVPMQATGVVAPIIKVSNYLVFAVLATLFCCLPTGIVAIAFAAQVNGKLQAGDLEGAQKASRIAKIWCWISVAAVVPILILMLIAIPNLQNLSATANEVSAKQSLRAIQIAENQYAANFPANGFACSLSALGGNASSGSPNPQAAQLLQPDLAGGTKAGYTFNIVNCQNASGSQQDSYTSYEVTATPQVVGKTGHDGLCLDMSGEIKEDPTGGTNCTVPVQ